jgi:hypothetical protein
MSQLSFNLGAGVSLRDRGIESVRSHAGDAWVTQAAELYKLYFSEQKEGALFENARAFALECGLNNPPHHNAWGSVAMKLSRSGKFVRTGEFEQSKSAKAHARTQAKWKMV